MSDHFDERDVADPRDRERILFRRLPDVIAAAMTSHVWKMHLGDIDPHRVDSREILARLPVLRKSDLPQLQKNAPPFGGFCVAPTAEATRLFTSPGPIFEPEASKIEAERGARALRAAGVVPGDIVVNCFSYHLTPGGFILDAAARALGCPVIPAGPGNAEQVIDVVAHYRAQAYCGTADFLKILLDKAGERGIDISSLTKACVSGAAFPPSLQAEIKARGIAACQLYATADAGIIAYETSAHDGLIVNEDIIVEILRPGTGDPVKPGEIGEVVVTTFDLAHPLIRLALGDLTAELTGPSPCGRTNMRIKGWLGRADQTAKVRGMFIRPEQIGEILRRHPEVIKARLVIGRLAERDTMTLRVEVKARNEDLIHAIAESLAVITKLQGEVSPVTPGSLPNDGKVIADDRPSPAQA